jgi:hypothetical protein
MGNYIDAKEELLEEMEANEGATIMEDMIKERRDWVTEFRRKNLGKFPDNLDAFHKRFDVETPEEIAAREAAAEADDGKAVALCAGVVQDHLLRGICRVEE